MLTDDIKGTLHFRKHGVPICNESKQKHHLNGVQLHDVVIVGAFLQMLPRQLRTCPRASASNAMSLAAAEE
jgi:hypothetical protein